MESLNASERILMTMLEPVIRFTRQLFTSRILLIGRMFVFQAVGAYKNIDEALPQLRFFKKPKSTYMAWKARLELGNIFIPTTMYVSVSKIFFFYSAVRPLFFNDCVSHQATDELKKPPFKNVTAKLTAGGIAAHRERPPEDGNGAEGRRRPDDPENFVPVKNERDYVDRHKDSHSVWDTIPGYMYGRHFVPLPGEICFNVITQRQYIHTIQSGLFEKFIPLMFRGGRARYEVRRRPEILEDFRIRTARVYQIGGFVRRYDANRHSPGTGSSKPSSIPTDFRRHSKLKKIHNYIQIDS